MSVKFLVNWHYPTNIIFGPDTIAELPKACRALGIENPLLVTDTGLKNNIITKMAMAANECSKMKTGFFAGIKSNPTGTNISEGVQAYKDGGHDGIIAFGGGSGIDGAKAIALMVGQDRPIWDFVDEGDNYLRANVEGMAPVVAVPTTSGTGAEVGRASVITNEETHVKKIIFHPNMMPKTVISDPKLTVGLPAPITAATGLDAFVHCFEAFCSPGYHPMADGIALEGMRLIATYLPRAYKDGNDLEARTHMLAAATMGATAFQKNLGGVHALAHPLGAVYDKHHGLLNAVLLPYVMERNRDALSKKMEYLARVLDLPEKNFDGVLKWVLDIRTELRIPDHLSQIGIPNDRANDIGVMAHADPSAKGNPVKLTAEDYTKVFLQAVGE